MQENLEIEYKTLVTEKQFQKMLSLYETETPIIQTNYYFDSIDRVLYRNKMSLRIREINHNYECTIKTSISKNEKKEYNFSCETLDLNSIDELKIHLKDYDVSSLVLTGKLTTERRIHNDGIGELCMDKSFYNNIIDYEIEYEQKNNCPNFFDRFIEILKKADIEYQPSISKLQRCLSSNTNN